MKFLLLKRKLIIVLFQIGLAEEAGARGAGRGARGEACGVRPLYRWDYLFFIKSLVDSWLVCLGASSIDK